MGIFDKLKDKGVKAVAKHKVKEAVNDKLNLDGKYDDKIESITEKAIDKIGVDNLMKAKKISDIMKNG